MKKAFLTVLLSAIVIFVGYKAVSDIFGEKIEVINNNFIPAREFLLNRGIILPKNIEKGNRVYKRIIISNREKFKVSSKDLLWITTLGREKQYFLFCSS